jgi:glutathione S-transferase
MITVYGEGRGFRVVWLLEEMGLPYRLRDVDLLAGIEDDAEFLAINPAGFIPAVQDETFPAYQQFLHLGEAGLAASVYFVSGARNIAPPGQRDNWSAGQALDVFNTRLGLVTRQLLRTPYLAGETFTAADISVGYALEMARRNIGFTFDETVQPYLERLRARDGYGRALDTCQATKGWWASRPA